MNRALRVLGIFILLGIILFAIWALRARPSGKPGQASFKDAFHSAINNPEGFAKSHFTGGVGVMLGVNPTNGLLMVMQVVPGSPAEKAGLIKGDLITQVNGVATAGRGLAQNVESIRGFVTGSVTLTIQRQGSTNQELVIHRSSWKNLGVPQ